MIRNTPVDTTPPMGKCSCCGDVNPIRHRSGYEGAAAVGTSLGSILVDAVSDMLRPPQGQPNHNS